MQKPDNHGDRGKKLPLHKLKAGYKLFTEVRGNSGGQLFNADAVIQEQDIITMRHFGVEEVWVYFFEEMRGQTKQILTPGPTALPCKSENRKKILVVDDVSIIRNKLRTILEDVGYEVVGEAEDGDESVDLTEALKPDLVTMDIFMRRMNGIDATRALRSKCPDVKVIMISQMAKPSLVVESMRAGAVNFILKPFEHNRITQVVKNALSK